MNRLASEKSPYLLQHAKDPVHWYSWSGQALAAAQTGNKPIFLSVGYSACHWCHVMAKESFADEEVAARLNRDFISIKVDREERPDIDTVYMRAANALVGQGGWPLTVFLTPDGAPFYAATYLPKQDRMGMEGLLGLLDRVVHYWTNEEKKVRGIADKLLVEMRAQQSASPPATLDPKIFDTVSQGLAHIFDKTHGGFGGAPKFPTPHRVGFLLGHFQQTGDEQALHMAQTTLDAMALGGIRDHLEGGFHRYSVDAQWRISHFEKMLYDQAGLIFAYLSGWEAVKKPLYAEVIRETCDYLIQRLVQPGGGLAAAEDADSEGEEGRFYYWQLEEIMQVLGAKQGGLVANVYGVTQAGNGEGTNNVLYLTHPIEEVAKSLGMEPRVLADRLETARKQLAHYRSGRVRPYMDDKIITGWNGYALGALARASGALGQPRYLEAAEQAAHFIWTTLRPGGQLMRRHRGGETAIGGFSEDFAYLAKGLIELYEASGESLWLERAEQIATELFEQFLGEDGLLYDSGADAEPLVLRPREVHDGAYPCANSVGLEVCLRLAKATSQPIWAQRAEGIIRALASDAMRYPGAFDHFLAAAQTAPD